MFTKEGENKSCEDTESSPHLPAQLTRSHQVYGNTNHGHQQLPHHQVHQQPVEICPQLESRII